MSRGKLLPVSWRRHIALFLALLLLVGSSGVLTRCIEADGSAKVEFLAALCCDGDPPPPTEGPGLSQVPTCAGCDDRPLDEGRWSRWSGPHDDALTLALTPAPVAELLPALAGGLNLVEPVRAATGPSVPRSERPSLLRC